MKDDRLDVKITWAVPLYETKMQRGKNLELDKIPWLMGKNWDVFQLKITMERTLGRIPVRNWKRPIEGTAKELAGNWWR